MPNKQLRILSINPGSRFLGVAVFDGNELLDWAVRVVSGKDINEKVAFMQKVVLDHINRYGSGVLALKKLHPCRSSPMLRNLVSRTRKFASNRNLVLREFSIDELKATLLSRSRGNSRLLMEEVAARYPFLMSEMEREKKKKRPYLIRMFEAVALGVVCANQLESRMQKVAMKTK